MLKVFLVYTLLFFIISSCKITEKDIIGIYKLDRFTKTTISINPDSTFEFSKNYRNPYLHPFDHPYEYYLDTKGTWEMIGKGRISLTSQKDTLIYPLIAIQTNPPRNKSSSHFSFYDKHRDLVPILYVQYNDSSTYSYFHRSMDYFSEDLTKRDTFEIHFFGYRPYTFISGEMKNQDYLFILKPVFQPNYFLGTEFKVKRKQLVGMKNKVKYRLDETVRK